MQNNKKSKTDPEVLKVPAFMRNKVIVSQARQKLIWTALDRKEAGLSYKSKKAIAPKSSQKQTITKVRRELQPNKKYRAIGEITSYIDKIQVAIIKLTGKLSTGDTILIETENYIYSQLIKEIQINRVPVQTAKKGDHIGIKVNYKPKQKAKIYIFN